MKKTVLISILLISITKSFAQVDQGVSGQELVGSGMAFTGQVTHDSSDTGDIKLKKEFLYDQHTLEDKYPYGDTVRLFQWDKIAERLDFIERLTSTPSQWAILQNYKNNNGRPPLAERRDPDDPNTDLYGVERSQSIPMYMPDDTLDTPERYGRDGSLVKIVETREDFIKVENSNFDGQWQVPERYVKPIDAVRFDHIIFVDRFNQNIATLEKADSTWLIRSMNPATTGADNPPYQEETPEGIFVIQEHKPKMFYLRDGTSEIAGFAPYASRFSDGGYVHGVPINNPSATTYIEYSSTLGTIPRSHMCVRNATSHAKFIYEWAEPEKSLIIVFD